MYPLNHGWNNKVHVDYDKIIQLQFRDVKTLNHTIYEYIVLTKYIVRLN